MRLGPSIISIDCERVTVPIFLAKSNELLLFYNIYIIKTLLISFLIH